MRFYDQSHEFTCGVDLHGRALYLCVLDQSGTVVLHRNLPASGEAFLAALELFRSDLVVGCECVFAWYWLADLCAEAGIDFVLGHALGMRAIHGLKTKSDKLGSWKIAQLLRGGNFPLAYVYPRRFRATRDLLRRRLHFDRFRSELLAHLRMSEAQANLEPTKQRLAHAAHRAGFPERFPVGSSRSSIAADCRLLDALDALVGGSRGRKQGNVHLKWGFSEAAVFLLRDNPRAQKLHSRLVARFGKAKALSVLAHKLGRAVFHMQKRKQPFDAERFYREA